MGTVKNRSVFLLYFSVTNFLWKAVADPTWVQSTIAVVYANICVVDNVMYMGTVSNSNKTWHMLMCVVYKTKNSLEKVL